VIKTRILIAIIIVLFISCVTTPKVEEGYISVDNSLLYYKTIGNGEPLIVLHGGPGFDHQTLMPYVGELERDIKVILYDQRGTGKSKGLVDPSTINIDTFIEDIEAVRKYFSLDKINLAGVSWGGILASFYAVRHPDKLKSLILFSTTASQKILYKMYPNMIENRPEEDSTLLSELFKSEEFQRGYPKKLEEYFKIFCKAQLADQSQYDKINIVINKNTVKNMSAVNDYIWKSISGFDLHKQLDIINCPTLIMHGRLDPLPLEAAEKIQEHISNSELVVFENSGHWIYLEERKKFKNTITNFISKNK
jgi:proline iminopeptidase